MKGRRTTVASGSGKVKSVGLRISIIISLLLIITLGTKTAIDSVSGYNSAITASKNHKYEETRKLAKQLEQRFISTYYTAKTAEDAVDAMMKNSTADERKRSFISNMVEEALTSNLDIGGLGVFFEPNAFDGKDAQNITSANKTGLMQSYFLREKGGTVKESLVDGYRESSWYKEIMETGTTVIT